MFLEIVDHRAKVKYVIMEALIWNTQDADVT